MTEAPQPRLLSTSQVAKLTGATLRQLQWWDEQGQLCPKLRHGSGGHGGKRRAYTAEDVGRIRLRNALCAKGVSTRECWAIVDAVWPLKAGDCLVVDRTDPLDTGTVATSQEALLLAVEHPGPVVVVRWD